MSLYKQFEAAKEAKEEAVNNLEFHESKRRGISDNLASALGKKSKLETKELSQRKNIDMANSDLNVIRRELKDKENHLGQLSDQLMLRQSDITNYEAEIEVKISKLISTKGTIHI